MYMRNLTGMYVYIFTYKQLYIRYVQYKCEVRIFTMYTIIFTE